MNAIADVITPAQPACVTDAGSWCAWFYRWTNSDFLARSADVIVSKTATITLIVVIALVTRFLLHRLITRVIEGAANGRVTRLLGRATARTRIKTPLVSERRTQRARTISSVLRSITSAVILIVALIMILAEFGVALAPILASAGIVGVAVGFGAQNLVRDFLSGMFMLLEDQYGVGDVIDVGDAVGTVEAVGLRITTIRDHQGAVWYVRNGEIKRVANHSQGYAVAVVDVPLAHEADVSQATSIIRQAAKERLPTDVLEPPQALGIDRITPDAVMFRVTVRTRPGRQWAVRRALNGALADALDAANIPLAGKSNAATPS